MINIFKFLDLTCSSEIWCDEIIRLSENLNRKDYHDVVSNHGYDIKREVKRLEKYYLDK